MPLPSTLGRHFAVGEALIEGATPDRLRARDLDRSVWGMRSVGPPRNHRERCELFATRLRPDAAVSHTSAALLYRAPLDFVFERAKAIHFTTPLPAPAPHAKGITGHHARLAPGDIRTLNGLNVTSPARTWLDLGAMLDLGDLVAVGDYLAHHRAAWVTVAELKSALERHGGRGIRNLRRAAQLLSAFSESRPESCLRVLIIEAGLPVPDINHTLVDSDTGKHLRPDFTFREAKLLIEYQGDYHRSKAQWRNDMSRRSRLEALGWKVMELNWDDLKNPIELAARIASALRERENAK